MSDVNANIHIGIDSSQALGQLRALQNEISSFNRSIVAGNAAAAKSQQMATSTMIAQIAATKQFSTQITNVESGVSRLSRSIDKGTLSLGQYFKYGAASTKTFGSVFRKEHNEVMRVAEDRVKRLQTQYVALGKSQNGMTRSLAIRPLELYNAQQAVGIQRGQIFNKLLHDGSTSLVNFGKNTQWAGRQLMVGFTVPLTIFGATASKIFMDLERQIINFKRVYGDLGTSSSETNAMVEQIKTLAAEYTKYGIAVKDTVQLAGEAAAAGAQGAQLMAVTAGATRLATLGMIDQQQALTATIALQSTFKMSAEELTQSVDFMNAVENQTVTSLDDITQAIPRVSTTIQGLGGDVQDLAIFLTAMREGGVNAAEGANALKSGLASMINPTKAADAQLTKVGINMKAIVNQNRGDILGMVQDMGRALSGLNDLERQQTLAKVFGKYQFARLSALFENINKEGSQANRVIDLTGASVKDLAALSEKELGQIEEAVGVKFTAAVEKFKLAIAPIGEQFLKIVTPLVDFGSKVADAFNNLSPNVKSFVTYLVAGVGIVAPAVLMLVGLFGNLAGNILKGVAIFNSFFNKVRGGGSSLNYLSLEAIDAMAAQASLEGQTERLTTSFNVQQSAANGLAAAYRNMATSARGAMATIPQGVTGTRVPRKFATGGIVPGTGNGDIIPALLTPGESVITKKATRKYAPILEAMNSGKIKGFAQGTVSAGGSSITADFRSGSLRPIQALFDQAAALGDDVRDAFVAILNDMKEAQIAAAEAGETVKKISKAEIQALARVSSDPRVQALGRTEQRFSYPGSEDPSIQIARQTGASAEQIAAEMRTAQISADGAVRAVQENAGLLRQLGYAEDQLAVEAGTARAHMVPVDKSTGIAAWHADFWQMQSQAENQFIETGIKQSQKNQRFLMRYLGETEESAALMDKINSGVGLTEREYEQLNVGLTSLLQDVRNNPALATGGTVSPTFIKGAIATVGAQQARKDAAGGQMLYADPRSLVGQQVSGTRAAIGSHSPAEQFALIGDDEARGIAVGLERSTPIAVSAAVEMAKETGMVTRTQMNEQLDLLQMDMAAQAQQGGLFNAGPYVGSRTLKPLGLNKNLGLKVVPQGMQKSLLGLNNGVVADAQSRLAGGTYTNSIKKATASAGEMAKVQGKVTGGLKKFGDILKSGNGKISGMMMGISGMTFALSMVDGPLGQLAQNIMPVVFGLQGIQMMMPLLSNPLGLLIAGVVGLTAGIVIMTNKAHDAQAAMIQHSIAVQGSAKAFDELAKDLGKIKPSEQFNAMVTGVMTKEDKAALEQAQAFLETESGKGMVSRAESLGGKDRVSAIQKELFDSMAIGIIDAKQAKAIAQSMSIALKDPSLGIALVSSISTYIRGSGREVSSAINYMLQSVSGDVASATKNVGNAFVDTKRLKDLRERSAGAGWQHEDNNGNVTVNPQLTAAEMEELNLLEQRAADFKQITVAVGPLLNASKKLAEMQSFLNLQFRSGSISLREYSAASKSIQKENANIADSINTIIDLNSENASVKFSDKLRQAAEALGMTSEQLDQIDTQVNAIVSVVNDLNIQKFDTAKLGDAVRFGLTSGTMSVGDAASLPKLLDNEKYKKQIEIAVDSGDVQVIGKTITMLNQLDALPDPLKNDILMDWNSKDFKTPEQFLAWQEKALTNATYFSSNPVLAAQTYTALQQGSLSNKKAAELEKTYAKGEKSMGVAFNVRGLEDMKTADSWYNKFNKAKDIKKVLALQDNWSSAFKAFGITYADFAALPNIKKAAIMLNVQAYMTLIEQYKRAEDLMNDADGINRLMGKAQGEAFTTNEAGLVKSTEDIVGAKEKKLPAVTPTPDKSGGGGDKANPWKDFLNGILSQVQMFSDMNANLKTLLSSKYDFFALLKNNNGIDDEIRKMGLNPLLAQQIMAMDPASAKVVLSRIKAVGKKKIQDRVLGNAVNTQKDEMIRKAADAGYQRRASMSLAGRKVKGDVISAIAGDPQKAATYLAFVKKVNVLEDKMDSASPKRKKAATARWRAANRELREYLNLFSKANVSERANAYQADKTQRTYDVTKGTALVAQLRASGMASDELIQSIMSNEAVAGKMFDAMSKGGAEFNNVLREQAALLKKEEQLIWNLKSPMDKWTEINSAQQDLLDAQKAKAEFLQVAPLEKEVQDIEKIVSGLNDQNDLLSRKIELRQRDMDILDDEIAKLEEQKDLINKVYDERLAALDKIEQANARIYEQQKGQLSIAQSLSVGDVAGAAKAMQDLQQQMAQDRAQSTRDALELARTRQLEQIDAQINVIKDKRKAIEDEIKGIQMEQRVIGDKIYYQQSLIKAKNDQISKIQDDINVKYASQALQLDAINIRLKQAEDHWTNIKNLAGIPFDAAAGSIAGPAAQTASGTTTMAATEPVNGTVSNGKIYYLGKWNRLFNTGGKVKKYATGSLVGGDGSRDSVNAMLTPGEFVMRKAAVDKWGAATLSSINMGHMPRYGVPSSATGVKGSAQPAAGPAVYNISVNVPNPNATPDEIASVVLSKIKMQEDKKIRSNRY